LDALRKLRRGMVRPGRDLLTGRVEVDECYIGGLEEGLPGRLNLQKALIVVAARERPGTGRIRMRHIVDTSAQSLVPFVQDSIEPDSVIHSDGWLGYLPLDCGRRSCDLLPDRSPDLRENQDQTTICRAS